jgi:hypothetical protein
MDTFTIGLRSQDFHEALKLTGTFGPKDVYYKCTLLIGKAATLAMHLRGLLYLEDYRQLEFVASTLGISSIELPAVLNELEHVNFVSISKSGDEIQRVDLRIPTFRSGYNDLGERWKELKPTEVEQASLATLEQLHNGPVKHEKLQRNLGLGKQQFSILSDVMKSGQLLSVQPVDGSPIVFSPLAVDGNPAVYLQWASKFPADVKRVLQVLRSQQGLPLIDPAVASNPALTDAVAVGVLMPVQVNGSTGGQRFLFAPKGGLDPEERTILDKARALVSCVRYGQQFSQGRRILYPTSILQRLKDHKRFKKGHPDLLLQYGLLVEKLIGEPVDEGGGYWNFQVHDTPENMKAFQVALEMIEHGDSPSAHIDIGAQNALLDASGYMGPASTRPLLVQSVSVSSETRAEMIRQMQQLARGMGSNG